MKGEEVDGYTVLLVTGRANADAYYRINKILNIIVDMNSCDNTDIFLIGNRGGAYISEKLAKILQGHKELKNIGFQNQH